MTYKQATIGLSVWIGVTYLVLIILYVVYLREQLKRGDTLSSALRYAAENKMLCSSGNVACSFAPDLTLSPPVVDADADTERAKARAQVEVQRNRRTRIGSATSGSSSSFLNTDMYSPDTARYAADLIGLLQDAVIEHREPVVMPSTTLIALLSGINTKGRGGRNQQIGWILQVKESMLPPGSKQQLWIAFRGTQTRAEWAVDFSVDQVVLDPVHAPTVRVHEGFFNSYMELAPTIRNYIKTLITPDTTVYITGHSLGATLAILCAADVCLGADALGVTDVRLYGFAAPRVGNSAFVSMVLDFLVEGPLKEFYLVCNDADIVPSVPPAVCPNFTTPSQPLLYDHFPMLHFNENWGSWMLNHVLPVYIENLEHLTTGCDVFTGERRPTTTGAIKARPDRVSAFLQRNQDAERRRKRFSKQSDDERSQMLRKVLFGF
jgi:hypothetical protein